MRHTKKYLFIIVLLSSICSADDDVEEVVVKADWRETKLIEEDASVLFYQLSLIHISEPTRPY